MEIGGFGAFKNSYGKKATSFTMTPLLKGDIFWIYRRKYNTFWGEKTLGGYTILQTC